MISQNLGFPETGKLSCKIVQRSGELGFFSMYLLPVQHAGNTLVLQREYSSILEFRILKTIRNSLLE